MNETLSILHRALLGLSVFPPVLFGLGYYLAPKWLSDLLGTPTADPSMLRYVGGFLLGAVVGAALSLRSGKWSEVRIVTIYLMTWSLLNSAAMFHAVATGQAARPLLINAVLAGIMGVGFLAVVLQRRAS